MKSDIFLKYGHVIRNIRLSRKISQEALADIIGVHQTYMIDVELGKRNVSLENIEKYHWLLNYSGKKKAKRLKVRDCNESFS